MTRTALVAAFPGMNVRELTIAINSLMQKVGNLLRVIVIELTECSRIEIVWTGWGSRW